MKKLICILLVLMLSLSLCACDSLENALEMLDQPRPKTFTVETLSIELNDDFFRLDMLAPDCDFCIGSENISIFGTRVDYAEQELFGVSAWEYAEAFREVMDESTMTEVTDLEGIPTMQFKSYDEDGELNTVLIAIYEASDCFWLVQYIFEADDSDELYPLVKQYALSVTCS